MMGGINGKDVSEKPTTEVTVLSKIYTISGKRRRGSCEKYALFGI